MSVHHLPFEALVNLLSYLGVSDLLAASCVSRLWREATTLLLAEKVTVMITDDAVPAVEIFQKSSVPYRNWVFKEVAITLQGCFAEFWRKVSGNVKSLKVLNADLSRQDFVRLLQQCSSLEDLRFSGLTHLLMTGTLLSSPEDVKVLSSSLKNVTHLHLACTRYLTDSLFSRIVSVMGPLRKLSLAGCQITFHEAIHKRFYPADGHVIMSDHVLTFTHILKYVGEKSSTLKEISLGQTIIDSEALYKLSKVPGLQLESLHLMSCDQLSKSGIQLLCENQKSISDLDLSFCPRITDYAVLSICQHLPRIKKLNLRRCQGITENGIRALGQLKYLVELNISHLETLTSQSVDEALGKEPRPTLQVLYLASLPLEWKTIARLAIITPNLVHLDVSMCVSGMNDRSIQAICKSLTKLQILNLNGCTAISDIGLAGHCLGQKDPDVSGTGLSLENLGIKERDAFQVKLGSRAEQIIRQEAEVKKYLQANADQIVQSSEYSLSNICGLQQLNLCGLKKLTDITLIYSLHHRELKCLDISHCQGIGESGLEAVARQCPSLEMLMLVECGQTSDQVILVIAHYLKRIKILDLQKCIKLTDDALDSLSNCYTLQYLDVSGCGKMSLEQVRYVQKKIPRLLNLHHRGVKERNPSGNEMDELPPMTTGHIPPPPPLFSKIKKKISRR